MMLARILWWAGGLLLVVLTLTNTAGGTRATALACDTTAFSGQVTKAGAPLTIRDTGGTERTVGNRPELVVLRDGTMAQFGDLRAGDLVNVTIPAGAADCAANRIEATGPAVAPRQGRVDLGWLLALAALVGLIGIPLLLRRRRLIRTTGRAATPGATGDRDERDERVEPDALHDRDTTRR